MDFSLSEENRMIQDAVREWTAKECPREKALEWDSVDGPPPEKAAGLSELGFFGITVPEEYGGSGFNPVGAVLVIEELAAMSPPLALRYARGALIGAAALTLLGSPEQQQTRLPGFTGQAVAVGPVLDQIETISHEGGLLNGKASGVLEGDLYLVAAGPEGSVFLVEAGPEAVLSPVESFGLKGAGLGELALTDAPAGPENRLAGPEKRPVLEGLVSLAAAAQAVGLAGGALNYALAYVRERVQFDRPVGRFPAVREKLTNAEVLLEGARALCREAAWLAGQGRTFHRRAWMAQVAAVRAAKAVGLDAVHVMGGYGYALEYDAQRYLRDAMCLAAYFGGEESLSARLGDGLGL